MILIDGAPLSVDLNWNAGILQNTFIHSIQAFLAQRETHGSKPSRATSETDPKWRSMRLAPQAHIPADLSHQFIQPSFVSISTACIEEPVGRKSISFNSIPDDDSSILEANSRSSTQSQFLEHTFAFHEALASSQIEPRGTQSQNEENEETEETEDTADVCPTVSFGSTTTDNSSICALWHATTPTAVATSTAYPTHAPSTYQITPLLLLPSAAYLSSIQPQTPTPNLLTVILSISSPRTVLIRRTQKPMLLYDILVADETRSNFSITFWLPPPPPEEPEAGPQQLQHLRRTLEGLRAGNIVLVRNIALSAFRGIVSGQSLNPHISRVRTTIDVLAEGGTDAFSTGQLSYELRVKFESVKRWASLHVAPDVCVSDQAAHGSKRKGKRERECEREDLPPDTPDD